MARYGDEFYGLSTYGTDTLVDFDVAPFRVSSLDYNKIFISWNIPTGDWDLIRLVRNGFGFPVTPDDGDLLFQGTTSTDIRDYTDVGQIPNNAGLIEGRTYYYSIFVRETTTYKWVLAGTNLGVSVKDYGTAELMYEYLPAIYKISNPYVADDNSVEINTDLFNFLQIFAFEHDLFKTTAENIRGRYNPLTLDGRLVPLLLNQFGFAYEKEIGLQQARSLLSNAVKIYSERGSLSGLKTFVTAFTGFNCDVTAPVNLMLDYNNSTFKETIGFWETISNSTLSRGDVTTEDPLVPPYFEVDSPSNFPNYTNGFLKSVTAATGDVVLACGTSAPLTRGIPVQSGKSYVFTVYSRSKTTARTITTDLGWYDRFGTFLGSAGEASSTNVVGSWTRTSAVVGAAPENAYYAVPTIRIESSTANEVHYFDAAQVELGAEPTTYQDARRIDVILRANRINQVLNPSFEESTYNWYFEGGLTEIAPIGAVQGSNYSAKITSNSDALCSASSLTRVSVTSGDQNAFSAYVMGTAGSRATLSIAWYDQSDEVISVAITDQTDITLDEWVRLEFTALAPATAITAAVTVNFTPVGAGSELYVDAVLFEKAAFVVPYFDGSGAGYAELGDTIWENGDVVGGRSHYYKNREVVTKRLFDVLPDYIPVGSPWAVLVAQPD